MRPTLDVEAVVVLLEHEHVVVGRRPERVAPDLPRAHRLVGTRVEDGRAVVRPRHAVVDVGHDVVELRVRRPSPSAERAEAQVVTLTAARVGAVRRDRLLRVDREVAHREVVVARRPARSRRGRRPRRRAVPARRADRGAGRRSAGRRQCTPYCRPSTRAGEVLVAAATDRRASCRSPGRVPRSRRRARRAAARGVRARRACTRSRPRGTRAPRGRRARAARTTGRCARRLGAPAASGGRARRVVAGSDTAGFWRRIARRRRIRPSVVGGPTGTLDRRWNPPPRPTPDPYRRLRSPRSRPPRPSWRGVLYNADGLVGAIVQEHGHRRRC